MSEVAAARGLGAAREATTEEEREAIWAFRYEVYVEELARKLGRTPGAERWVHDAEDDEPYTIHLYTEDAEGISGVLRARSWPPGGVPAADFELFSMERFPGIQQLATGELGRLMVRPNARGAPPIAALMSAAYEIGTGRMHTDLAFLNCAPSLVRLYRKLGARPYDGRLVPTPDGIEVPLVLALSDLDAMTAAGSFLLPLAERHFGPGRRPRLDVGRFAHLFETRTMPLEVDPGAVWSRLGERGEGDGQGNLLDLLSPETVKKLSAEGLLLSVSAGQLLTEKGLGQRDMFVVLDGLFEAVDGERRLRVIGEGEVIGEMAFFSSSGRRTASVRAATDGRVLLLRRGFVDKLRKRDPACAAEILFHLARVLADRTAAFA